MASVYAAVAGFAAWAGAGTATVGAAGAVTYGGAAAAAGYLGVAVTSAAVIGAGVSVMDSMDTPDIDSVTSQAIDKTTTQSEEELEAAELGSGKDKKVKKASLRKDPITQTSTGLKTPEGTVTGVKL